MTLTLDTVVIAHAAWRLGEIARFIGDSDIEDLAANAVDIAADDLTYGTDTTIPLDMILAARKLVMRRHDIELAAREQDEADALADAVEAGDLTPAGDFIPWGR